MIHDDGGVQYLSYTYYIIRSLLYTMNNCWVHKGVEDAVSNDYIELEEPQDRHICHGFVKIGTSLRPVVLQPIFLSNCFIVFLLQTKPT